MGGIVNKNIVIIALIATCIGHYSVSAMQTDALFNDYKQRMEASLKDNPQLATLAKLYAPQEAVLRETAANERAFYELALANKHACSWSYTLPQSRKKLYVKAHDFARLVLATRIKNYLHNKNITYVKVPEKNLVFAGDSWFVIAHEISDTQNEASQQKIELQQIKELTQTILDLGYYDCQGNIVASGKVIEEGNIMLHNGIFYLIDTERFTFSSFTEKKAFEKLVTYLKKLKEYTLITTETDALNWLLTTQAEHPKDSSEKQSVLQMSSLDSPNQPFDIDALEKMKKSCSRDYVYYQDK